LTFHQRGKGEKKGEKLEEGNGRDPPFSQIHGSAPANTFATVGLHLNEWKHDRL